MSATTLRLTFFACLSDRLSFRLALILRHDRRGDQVIHGHVEQVGPRPRQCGSVRGTPPHLKREPQEDVVRQVLEQQAPEVFADGVSRALLRRALEDQSWILFAFAISLEAVVRREAKI